MKSSVFLFLISSFFLRLDGQNVYKFPETFNSIYNFKPEESGDKLIKDDNSPLNSDLREDIAVQHFYNEQFLFDYNQVYMDWHEVEVYLLKVLRYISPIRPGEHKVDLFLSRSTNENASISKSGNIFLNMGVICEAENEAFLASIMGHEIGHFKLNHVDKRYAAWREYRNGQGNFITRAETFFRISRILELQADSFAITSLVKAGVSVDPLIDYFDSGDQQQQIFQNSRSYKNMVKATSLDNKSMYDRKRKAYTFSSTHPESIWRYDFIKKNTDACSGCYKDFFIDSIFFTRLKKTLREERKKISFEEGQLNNCLFYAFKDYLQEPKNLKNLYYIVESLRRTLYTSPYLKDKGFLTENLNDDHLYYNNKSITHKPEYIFKNEKEFIQFKEHPLIELKKKPFETYEEAFFYFSTEALNLNLNEANFSRALYYKAVSSVDSSKAYLQKYVQNGIGLHIDYAKDLLTYNKPILPNEKLLLLYNNIGNYTVSDYNYYQTLQKRKANAEIREIFTKNRNKPQVIIINELLGEKPLELYEMKKLLYSVFLLYNEDDIEACKKIRLNSHFAGEDREIPFTRRKNLFVFAPEWYSWFKENGYSKLFLVDVIHQYKKSMAKEDVFNNYTGYYLDFAENRPYFRDADRIGFKYKQKEKEILAQLYAFLYE